MKLLTLTLLFAGCSLGTSPSDLSDAPPMGVDSEGAAGAGAVAFPTRFPLPKRASSADPPVPAPAPMEDPTPAAMNEEMDDPPQETDDPPAPEPSPPPPPPPEPPPAPIPSTTDALVGQCPTSAESPLSCDSGMCKAYWSGKWSIFNTGPCVSDGDCPDRVYNPGGGALTSYLRRCYSGSCVIDCS